MSKINLKLTLVIFVLGGFCFCQSDFARGDTEYTITDLGVLDGNSYSRAYDINDNGQVVGISGDSAFLWENDIMKDLGTLGGSSSRAYGINNSGQVVGGSKNADNYDRAFLWQEGKAMQDLGAVFSWSKASNCAKDINDDGDVVGISGDYAFIWKKASGMRKITLNYPTVGAINNSGQMVGSSYLSHVGFGSLQRRAFLWKEGQTLTWLGILSGWDTGTYSSAQDINDLGQLVGVSSIAGYSTHAFSWKSGSRMKDLGTLGGSSSAYGINNSGQIVGTSNNCAFLWKNNEMINLNRLVRNGTGWQLKRAWAINNSGQIVGYGTFINEERAFLLTPLNQQPVLSWKGEENYQTDGLDPESGTREAIFTYQVKYTDGDGDAPANGFPRVQIRKGGVAIMYGPFVMSFVNGNYNSGAIYNYTTTLAPGTDYSYYFEARDSNRALAIGEATNSKAGPLVMAKEEEEEEEEETMLEGEEVKIQGGKKGYVNPDKGEQATIYFKANSAGKINIKVFTLRGQLVWERTKETTGERDFIVWSGKNCDGIGVPSGIYLIYINGPGINITKKVAILKYQHR